MIYLDNSATTNHKPFMVKFEVFKSTTCKFCSNPHRAGNNLSNFLAEKILKTRENLCSFVNCESIDNVIFTSGCTEALNLAILGTMKKGGHIITNSLEHNSCLRPLYNLKNKGIIDLTIIQPEKDGSLNLDKIKNAVRDNTYLITLIHTSNVTGMTNDIKTMGKFCKERNILYLVDCAQSAGHEKIDMQKNNIDFITIAGHKGFYALTGIGALIVSNKAKKHLKPIKFGGTGTKSNSPIQPEDFPDGFESGTCNTSGILSLNAGLNFVRKNQEKINNKIARLSKLLISELEKIKEIKIYKSNNINSGVISFNIENFASNEVSNFLSEKYNICVRSGLHCAPLVHKHYGTLENGMIRASISYFNTEREIKKLVFALKDFISLNKK